jgi:excisionase family DNA binding protein
MALNLTSELTAPVLLTTEQAAALLHCSPKTIALDRVRRRWKVPFLKVGRLCRYDRAAVLRWLADQNPSARMEG